MAADIENDIKNMLKGKNAAGMAGEKRSRPVSGDKRSVGAEPARPADEGAGMGREQQ